MLADGSSNSVNSSGDAITVGNNGNVISISGSVVVGGSAQVDICSQRIGIYADNNVYLGYVWNGSTYEASGSPMVKINSPDSVAAITPDTPEDFVVGIKGIKANACIYMADGSLTTVGSEKALEYDSINPLVLPSSYKYKPNTEASARTELHIRYIHFFGRRQIP